MIGNYGKIRFDGAIRVFLVNDIASTMHWYETRLGFNVQGVPESAPLTFGFLRKDNVEIFLQQLDYVPRFARSDETRARWIC
jgi:hypothetical protein